MRTLFLLLVLAPACLASASTPECLNKQDGLPPVEVPLDTGFVRNELSALLKIVLDAQTIDKSELLHCATIKGCPEAVKLLLKYGVNINDLNKKNGFPALFQAILLNHTEVFRVLLEGGADKNFIYDGASLLHYAAMRNNSEMIKLLLKYGANIDAVDTNGCTPLYYAAKFDCPEAVKMLVMSHANRDIQDITGKTPLDIAAKNIKELLDPTSKQCIVPKSVRALKASRSEWSNFFALVFAAIAIRLFLTAFYQE